MEEHEKIDISETVDNLSDEKVEVAFHRALLELGIDLEDFDEEDEEHKQAFHDSLLRMGVAEIVGNLAELNLVQVTNVSEEGELLYSLTEEGKRVVEEWNS